MIKAFHIFLLLFGFSCFTNAQQIQLKGQVSIHNSKYETGTIEYVSNAYITAAFTKPVSSDAQGKFTLEFVGIPAGTSIQLDAEKSGFEVVNRYELQDVVINRKAPLRIYLTTRGKLAQAQIQLYNISKEALYEKHNRIISRLKENDKEAKAALKELEAYFGRTIEDQYEAVQLVKSRMEDIEQQLPKFAQELGSTNLDFASDLYIQAYKKVESGEIELALALLDSTTLEKSYAEAVSTLAKGEKLEVQANDLKEQGRLQLDQLFKSLELKANAQYLLFQYGASARTFERLIELYETHQIDPLKKAKVYDELGTLFYLNGQFNKAESYQKQALVIKDSLLPKEHTERTSSLNMMAQIKAKLGEYDQAITLQNKIIQIKEGQLEPDHPDLAVLYANLSLMLSETDSYEEAKDNIEKAIEINIKNFGEDHKLVALNYSVLGDIYKDLSLLDKALEYELKGLEIRKRILPPDDPKISYSLNGLGQIYRMKGNYTEALKVMMQALDIAKSTYHSRHYVIAGHLSGISEVYHQMGELEKAIEFQKLSLEIKLETFGEYHRSTGNSYNLLSRFYNDSGDYDQAMINQLKSIEIKERVLPENDSRLATSYYTMGIIQQSLNDLEKAVEYHQKALEIRRDVFGEEHQQVSNSLYRLAQIFIQKKDYNSALANMIEVTAFDEKANGFPHQYVAEDYITLCKIYIQLSDLDNATRYRSKAKEVVLALDKNNRANLEKQLSQLDAAIIGLMKKD